MREFMDHCPRCSHASNRGIGPGYEQKYVVVSKLSPFFSKSNRKAMNRNWSNQKANPALKTKTGNKLILQISNPVFAYANNKDIDT